MKTPTAKKTSLLFFDVFHETTKNGQIWYTVEDLSTWHTKFTIAYSKNFQESSGGCHQHNEIPSNFTAILSKILTSSFHFNFQVVNAYFRSILKVIKRFNPRLTLSLLHFNPPFLLKFQASKTFQDWNPMFSGKFQSLSGRSHPDQKARGLWVQDCLVLPKTLWTWFRFRKHWSRNSVRSWQVFFTCSMIKSFSRSTSFSQSRFSWRNSGVKNA